VIDNGGIVGVGVVVVDEWQCGPVVVVADDAGLFALA
jgi:hypothetical protein